MYDWMVTENLAKVVFGRTTNKVRKSYVYIVVSPNDDIVYVGKGTGDRYTHVLSGTSSSYQLNKDHFLGIVHRVYIYRFGMSDTVALSLESRLISKFKPPYNRETCGQEFSNKYIHLHEFSSLIENQATVVGKSLVFNPNIPINQDVVNYAAVNLPKSPLFRIFNVVVSNLLVCEKLIIQHGYKGSYNLRRVRDGNGASVSMNNVWKIIRTLQSDGLVTVVDVTEKDQPFAQPSVSLVRKETVY